MKICFLTTPAQNPKSRKSKTGAISYFENIVLLLSIRYSSSMGQAQAQLQQRRSSRGVLEDSSSAAVATEIKKNQSIATKVSSTHLCRVSGLVFHTILTFLTAKEGVNLLQLSQEWQHKMSAPRVWRTLYTFSCKYWCPRDLDLGPMLGWKKLYQYNTELGWSLSPQPSRRGHSFTIYISIYVSIQQWSLSYI